MSGSGTTVTRPRGAAPPATIGGVRHGVGDGGSDVYRIDSDGNPERLWSHAQDIVYAIAFDAQGTVLLGIGQQGLHLSHRFRVAATRRC